MAWDEGKKVTLKSSDGEEFFVEEAVAKQSQVIRHMIEDGFADSVIPLHNVNSKILAVLISLLARGWDFDFEKVDLATLFHLRKAADYLNIKGLGGLIKQTMADMVKGKTPEEIYELYKKKNMTPEEKEEFRRSYLYFFGVDHFEGPRRVFDNKELREELRWAYEEYLWASDNEELDRTFEELMRAFDIEEHRWAFSKLRQAFDIDEPRTFEELLLTSDNEECRWAFEELRRAFDIEELREMFLQAFDIEEHQWASENEELRQAFEELRRASNFEELRRAFEELLRACDNEELRWAFDIEELRELFLLALDNEEHQWASDNEELRQAFEELRRASNFEELRRAFEELRRAFDIVEEKQLLDHMRF